jgi:hypothetical protein
MTEHNCPLWRILAMHNAMIYRIHYVGEGERIWEDDDLVEKEVVNDEIREDNPARVEDDQAVPQGRPGVDGHHPVAIVGAQPAGR